MKKKAVTIEASQLIGFLDQELKELPDNRKGDNKKYTVNHALKAGFSVFFTQSPSFLQHQRLMKPKKGKDNAQSLFGLEEIPCLVFLVRVIREFVLSLEREILSHSSLWIINVRVLN